MQDEIISDALITHVGVIGLIYAAAIAVMILLMGHNEPRRFAGALRQPLHLISGGLQRARAMISQAVARLLRGRRKS
jgi:hypothetical protein